MPVRSYNGDLRGVIEDVLGVNRDVAISVPGFHSVGALVEGGPLLATVRRWSRARSSQTGRSCASPSFVIAHVRRIAAAAHAPSRR